MAKVLGSVLKVSLNFQTYTLEKGMNIFILPAMC